MRGCWVGCYLPLVLRGEIGRHCFVAATDRFEEWLKRIYMIEHWILANRGIFQVPFKHEIDRAHLVYWDILHVLGIHIDSNFGSSEGRGGWSKLESRSCVEIEHDERE
jgi:hypothetical protein